MTFQEFRDQAEKLSKSEKVIRNTWCDSSFTAQKNYELGALQSAPLVIKAIMDLLRGGGLDLETDMLGKDYAFYLEQQLKEKGWEIHE